MAPAAVDVRSPMASAQPTASASAPQNPTYDYQFTFGGIASTSLSEDQGNPSSSSFDAGTNCGRGSAFPSNVGRTGSRARPRLVKMRRQLGSQQARPRAAANEVLSGSNPVGSGSARMDDGAGCSNAASKTCDRVRDGTSACTGFSFSVDDVNSVKFESVGFVFGANQSADGTNLESLVGGAAESAGNLGGEDGGKVKIESGRESVTIENLSFVFGTKQGGFASSADEEKSLSGEYAGKSLVGDKGNVGAESEIEFRKFDDVGFIFGSGQSNLDRNSNMDMGKYGERADKLGGQDAGKMKFETETEFGKHDNGGYVFGVSLTDLPSNPNLRKGGSAVSSGQPDCEGDKVNTKTEKVTEEFADQSELGSTSSSREREHSKNVDILDSRNGDMSKAMNEAESGKHVDSGFVFGSSWSNSVLKNLEKRESVEKLGRLVTEDGVKAKVESGAEYCKVKDDVANFTCNGDRSSNGNCEKEFFVFGSSSERNSSFNECMSTKCPSEIQLNGKYFGKCKNVKHPSSDLGSDVDGKGKSVFGSASNVASFSSPSPLFQLPDEMRKMKIDDLENVDGIHKTENSDKSSCANHEVASMFERSKEASGSFNRNLTTGASIGISSSKEFTFQAGPSKDFDVDQFPQCQINDERHQNATAGQSNGSASEIPFIIGVENRDGNCFTGIPDESGLSFTAFSAPKWDPSCFTGNLFPEVNKKVEFAVKGQSIKSKKVKKTKGKLKSSSLSKANLGQNHVLKEFSSQENPDLSGSYSPMDFSPYQETAEANPYTREASLTSQEFNPDTDFATSGLHSTVPNNAKYEDLAAAEGLDINRNGQKSGEQNDKNFWYDHGRSFVCDFPSKGFFSEAETSCSTTKSEKFCSSSGPGVTSTEVRSDFSSNMEKQEDNCNTQFHFAPSSEDMKEKFFTFSAFSASSSPQGSVSAIKGRHRRKSRGKVGRHSPAVMPSTNVSTQAHLVELSLHTGTSPQVDTMDKSEAHEQFKQEHVTFSVAIQETCEKFRLRGNEAYKNRELSKAEDLYTQGIISVPSSETMGCCLKPLLLCYSNRAATRMRLGRIREALGDCMMAITLDPNFLKVQMRAANCHLVLGEVEEALQCFNRCLESGAGVCLDRKVIIEAADGLQKAQHISVYLCCQYILAQLKLPSPIRVDGADVLSSTTVECLCNLFLKENLMIRFEKVLVSQIKKVAEYISCSAKLLEQRTSGAALSALEIIAEALSISLYAEKLLELKAEALLMLRKYDEAIKLCEQTLSFAEKNFSSNVDGSGCESYSVVRLWRWCLISKCYFHLGRLEAALDLLQKLEQVGSLKDKSGIKSLESSISLAVTIRELLRCKNAGNEAFRSRKHTEAVEHYTTALSSNVESRPFAAICLCNRAAAHQALGQIADAISDCSLAMALDENYAKAVSRRATLHEMIRDYRHAATDLQRLVSILEHQSSEKTKQFGTPGSSMTELRQAQRHLSLMEEEAKKGIPLDFYLIFGIKPSDTSTDIKKAYRKAALKHHPDKAGQFLARSESGDEGQLWKEISQEVHKDADRLFKMIGEAYAVLSDPTKRSEYDFEEDLRKAPKESRGSSNNRRTPDSHSSPFERSANRRNGRENWKTYGNSHFRW